jgi:uncharacterized membrane protein YeaQ/YmgE (transglycosylase-associated protein family)
VPELELSPSAQHWVNVVLLWVGFGTLAGLLARLLWPGREPASAAGTVVLGILGSAVGPLLLSRLLGQGRFNPISPLGFLAAIGSAFVLLVGYRLLLAGFARSSEEEVEEEEADDVDDEEE